MNPVRKIYGITQYLCGDFRLKTNDSCITLYYNNSGSSMQQVLFTYDSVDLIDLYGLLKEYLKEEELI